MTVKNNIKPVLKWVGGKRQLVPNIREYYQDLKPKKYIEPFFGGGAVYIDILHTLGMKYKETSIINDINKDLIELYRNIKTNPDEIIYHCKQVEKDYKKYDYYFIRQKYNGIDRDKNKIEKYKGIERSAALIVINRTCFNGLYRVNKSGLFNVPRGSYKNPTIIDEDNLYLFSNLLPPINNIRNKDYDKIEDISKGDLVYFDPPYHPLNATSSFISYSGEFGTNDQIRLRDYFENLNKKGVHVILSNSSSKFIAEIYSKYNIQEVFCGRSINSKGDKRGKIPEYIILSDNFSK
ncbi:MAG: Dam family site-specific DNA-(adenine-N6)-methyltransferase [Gammaproteobacteria bacterium]